MFDKKIPGFVLIGFLLAGNAVVLSGQVARTPTASLLCAAKWIGTATVPMQQPEPSSPPANAAQTILKAKTAIVVGTTRVVSQTKKSITITTTTKAEEALKKELTKWGRFRLVDDPAQADLILVISEDRTENPMTGARIRERLAIFNGGNLPSEYATPLWDTEAKQAAFGLGGRPAGKLVEQLRKAMGEFERAAATAKAQPSEVSAAPPASATPVSIAPANPPGGTETAAPEPAVAIGIPDEKSQAPMSTVPSESIEPAQILLSAKTVAIVARGPKTGGGGEGLLGAMLGGPPQFIHANSDRARKEVVKEIEKWKRYTVVDDPTTADLVIFVEEWNRTAYKLHLVAQMQVLNGGPSWDQSRQVLWQKQDDSDSYVVTKGLVSQFRRDVEKLAKGEALKKE